MPSSGHVLDSHSLQYLAQYSGGKIENQFSSSLNLDKICLDFEVFKIIHHRNKYDKPLYCINYTTVTRLCQGGMYLMKSDAQNSNVIVTGAVCCGFLLCSLVCRQFCSIVCVLSRTRKSSVIRSLKRSMSSFFYFISVLPCFIFNVDLDNLIRTEREPESIRSEKIIVKC